MNILILDAFIIGASLGFILGMTMAWQQFLAALRSAVSDVTAANKKKGPWE